MGNRISPKRSEEVKSVLFQDFGDSGIEKFLMSQLTRYLPDLTRKNDEEIRRFGNLQHSIYVYGQEPIIGTPIASLNPSFIASVGDIVVGDDIYTRASTKENGYRMQLHRGIGDVICAFTRQFNRYDFRILPEILIGANQLPVIIGDAELINAHHSHLAGFNRIKKRIPGVSYWPKNGMSTIDDEKVRMLFGDTEVFESGMPKSDFEMTLAFHGLFSIAHPKTWDQPLEKQLTNMVTLTKLPIDYKLVDELLDQLSEYLFDGGNSFKVVDRTEIKSTKHLKDYEKEHNDRKLEGICVVQSDGTIDRATSYKIKNYETIDTILLGFNLHKKDDGLKKENIKGALLGLYDEELGCYLPAFTINLDMDGVQVKTDWQRQEISDLIDEILPGIDSSKTGKKVTTLFDVYMYHGLQKISKLSSDFDSDYLSKLYSEIPKGNNLVKLIDHYNKNALLFNQGDAGTKKTSPKRDKFIREHSEFFKFVDGLTGKDKDELLCYFSNLNEVKRVSNGLVQPQFLVDLENPVFVEAKAFDIKFGLCRYPINFNPKTLHSIYITNVYGDGVRTEKNTTTDYATINEIAKKNSA